MVEELNALLCTESESILAYHVLSPCLWCWASNSICLIIVIDFLIDGANDTREEE